MANRASVEQLKRVKDDVQDRAKETARELKGQAKHLQQGVGTQIQNNPLLFAGLALGAGFVVGGGLRATVTGPLMRVGGGLAWKFIVLPAVTTTLMRALGMTEED